MTNEDPDTARDVEKADEVIAAAEDRARPSEIERLRSSPKTLDAKWLDPECWNGCQSLVYKQERDHFKKCALELGDQFAKAKAQVASLIASQQMCVGAAGIGDFSELCGWIDDKKQQVESLEKQIKHACEDWAEDDTAIRNLCRPFLTEETCDHDGYAVVPVVDAVKNSLESLEKQCAAMRSAFENITTKLPQPYMPVPTYYEVACTQWKELEDCFDNATAGRDYFKVCPKCGHGGGK